METIRHIAKVIPLATIKSDISNTLNKTKLLSSVSTELTEKPECFVLKMNSTSNQDIATFLNELFGLWHIGTTAEIRFGNKV